MPKRKSTSKGGIPQSKKHCDLLEKKKKKKKPKKDGIDQTRAVTEKKTYKAEDASRPKPPVGRFRQYTPLIATTEHVLNQIFGSGLL